MIRLLIVTDIQLYAEGLEEALSKRSEFFVVGTAADGPSAIARLRDEAPGVVLLDAALPDSTRAATALLAVDPTVKIVSLAVPESEGHVIECAKAGASGFVTRDASIATLVDTLIAVARGELFCPPKLADCMFRHVRRASCDNAAAPALPDLTVREMEVAELIARGLSNKEIARELYIEVATVKHHVHGVLSKLKVRRRAEAAVVLRGHQGFCDSALT